MAHATNELGWVEAVGIEWPGPIAHEYHALRGMFPETRAAAAKGDYQVLAAFLQLRDVAEILVKLPAMIMLRDADRLSLPVTKIKSKLLSSPGFGDWHEWSDTLARQLLEHEAEAWTAAVARIFRLAPRKITGFSQLFNGREGLIYWRNRELGHGALRKDLDVLATELTERVVGLNEQLALVAAAQPWKDLTLRITGAKQPLVGHESIRRSHDASAGSHTDIVASVVCDCGSASRRLDLGPYLAARICRKCDRQDVFFFNGRSGKTPPHQVQYLDYRMGHSLLEPQANDPRWADEVSQAKEARGRGSVGDDWIDTAVSEFLDSTDFGREYVQPTYIADGIRTFLEKHDRGIVWLRAPAHTGKTVFADTAAKLLADDPGDVFVATFKIKREYRFGIEAFKTFITKTFLPDTNVNHPFAWARADGKALAKAFAADADRLLERARDLSVAHDRVLLVIDGLDELPAPTAGAASDIRHGIADLIPKADSLPAGMFLVLTSRPVEKGETPAWVRRKVEAALRGQKHVHTIDIDRDTPDYRRLLRQVFDNALVTPVKKSRQPKHPGTLFETIGNRADWTFLHFNHLVRLLKDGLISEADLSAMQEHGDQLFLAYFRKLEETVGQKHFDRIRELLLVLAACEEAHDQAARIVPAFFFDAEWKGLPLDELTGLLHELSPGKGKDGPRVPLRMLFLLKSVADVLRSHRGDDEYSRHRIGLKGMVAAMRADRRPGGWAESLDATHLRFVREAIAAESAFATGLPHEKSTPQESYLLNHGWFHFRALAELGTSASQSDGHRLGLNYALPVDDLLKEAAHLADYQTARAAIELTSIVIDYVNSRKAPLPPATATRSRDHALAIAYEQRAVLRQTYFDFTGAIADYKQAEKRLTKRGGDDVRRVADPEDEPRDTLIRTLMNHGTLVGEIGQHEEAVKYFSKAIQLLLRPRRDCSIDRRWKLKFEFAIALLNRGRARSDLGREAEARRDYNRSVDVLQRLRRSRGEQWNSHLCDTLASALMNRGILYEARSDCRAASRDYDHAITLITQLFQRSHDAWTADLHHTLARTYANRRGIKATGSTPVTSLEDLNVAITLYSDLRERLDSECPPEAIRELAVLYDERGKLLAESGRHRRAITDYGRAIATLETLRDELGERWSPAMANSLEELHERRAELLDTLGRRTEARADRKRAGTLKTDPQGPAAGRRA